MTNENLESELARLRAENEALRARTRRGTHLRVSEKAASPCTGSAGSP